MFNKIGGSNFLDNIELITTVHFLRAREPFGASSPLARLDSAARLTLALNSLSLTSLCLATLRLRCGHPACTLLHQPSLRPGVFSPLCRQVRVDLGPALNRPSLQPPPDSAFTLAIPRLLVPSFPPPLLLQPRCHHCQRRRRLLRTSPHPNPHLEDTSTLETSYRLAKATPESAT